MLHLTFIFACPSLTRGATIILKLGGTADAKRKAASTNWEQPKSHCQVQKEMVLPFLFDLRRFTSSSLFLEAHKISHLQHM